MTTPLKILTWNIWMMPPAVLQSPKNEARAAAIAQELLARDDDVLCLVKAFDSGARAVLERQLGARYPHRHGPINNHGGLLPPKINGGVWVLSRMPLAHVHTIEFRDHAGAESFSRKGAVLLRGDWYGHAFQLIATHLQGESAIDSNHQPIRDRQISQISDELIPRADPNVPLIFCGDFNTERRDRKDPFAQAPSYTRMLALLQAQNGEEQRFTLEDKRVHNDLAEYDSGRVAELDYVLLRRNGKLVTGTWQRVVMRRQGWDGPHGRRDLSYRFAVGASFTFG